MRKLDIISPSPNSFIFQEESNKTLFGGILSLIYLVSIFTIYLYYRVIFFFSPSYEITSFTSFERGLTREQINKFYQSEKYNPNLQFKFSLLDNNGTNLSERFILYDEFKRKQIQRGEIIERRVNDIDIYVLYKCLENETYCEIDNNDKKAFYQLILYYQGFLINPWNTTPITKLDDNDFNSINFLFNPDFKLEESFKWIIIRMEETKGISRIFDIFKEEEEDNVKENDIYIGGKIEKYTKDIYSTNSEFISVKNTRFMMRLYIFGTKRINGVKYEDYVRRETSLLDVYAKAFSLWMSFYSGLSFLFSKLYSKSFDKYKIMDTILKNKIENFSKNKIPIQKINQLQDIQIKDNLLENDPFNDKNDVKDNENDNLNNIENFIDKNDKEEMFLPKRTFMDFIYNTFYIESKCHSEKQKLIWACNNLVLKYYSIENIIYNQIMLENLLRDYKWNNPELKNIMNNDSFAKLKENLKYNIFTDK